MSSQPGPSHVPLAAQVGGHPGVMTTQDGFLLVKPSLPKEIAFYTSISQEPHLLILQDFVPKFYGTLRLEGKVASEGVALNEPGAIKPVGGVPEAEKDKFDRLDTGCLLMVHKAAMHGRRTLAAFIMKHIVLENLTYTFLKPNILDVKLGTVLYDEDATPEKRARMEKTARETTTSETGIRLTGFQVYDLVADKPIVTPKGYGKSIKAAELPEGVARFFPLASSATPAESTSDSIGTGLPKDILLPLLSDLRLEIQELHDVLARLDVRMVGASLLILYEADWDRAREELCILHACKEEDPEEKEEGGEDDDDDKEEEDDNKEEKDNDKGEEDDNKGEEDDDKGEEDDDKGEEDDDKGEEDDDKGEEDDDKEEEKDDKEEENNDKEDDKEEEEDDKGEEDEGEEEEDEEDGKKPIGPPSIVKLIDFAHSKLVLGEGPDEGVLLGLRTFIGLLDGRIEQVKAA